MFLKRFIRFPAYLDYSTCEYGECDPNPNTSAVVTFAVESAVVTFTVCHIHRSQRLPNFQG